MASRFVEADRTLIEELKHGSENKNTNFFILRIKCSLNLLIGYVCFDSTVVAELKGLIAQTYRARMKFPQKFCPFISDKPGVINK